MVYVTINLFDSYYYIGCNSILIYYYNQYHLSTFPKIISFGFFNNTLLSKALEISDTLDTERWYITENFICVTARVYGNLWKVTEILALFEIKDVSVFENVTRFFIHKLHMHISTFRSSIHLIFICSPHFGITSLYKLIANWRVVGGKMRIFQNDFGSKERINSAAFAFN